MRRLVIVAVAAAFAASCGGAARPIETSSAAPTAAASERPSPSPTPAPPSVAAVIDHAVVYFARDRMPPIAAHVDGAGSGATPDARISSRLVTLFAAKAPAGSFNVALSAKARPGTIRVDGDLVTLDFVVPRGDWGIAGSAATRSFIQQIVYTATEEVGIRRALITENGRQAVIGGEGVVIDHAVAREDVAGYAPNAMSDALMWRTDPQASPIAITSRLSVDADVPSVARFVVDTGLRGADAKASIGFSARLMRNDERAFPELGKWVLALNLPDTRTSDDPVRLVERTPVRLVRTMTTQTGTRYELALDDQRPWRVTMLYEPLRVVVDYGGDPDAVSANIALYRPAFGSVVRSGDAISGAIRAFEARFEYRVADARGATVLDQFATASLGTAELWGSFDLRMPPLPAGSATLEILIHSPKDGSVSERVFTSFEVAGP